MLLGIWRLVRGESSPALHLEVGLGILEGGADRRSFGCLDNSDYHPWVKAIFEVARAGTVFQTLAHYPLLIKVLLALIPTKFIEERDRHMQMTLEKLKRRMQAGQERADLVEGLLKRADEWVMIPPSPPRLPYGLQKLTTNKRASPSKNSKPTPQSS